MSSLHYLRDQDIIELLGDYVLKAYLRKKQKVFDDARAFHEKNSQDYQSEKLKRLQYYLYLRKKIDLF